MTDYQNVWLVIPVYNEQDMVGKVIAEAKTVFPNIVCVDDGSDDASAKTAEKAGALVIQHPINLGQGAALQTGIDYVNLHTDGQYLFTFDADGQHRLEDAQNMLKVAKTNNLGFVLGSRFLAGDAETGWIKKIILRTAAKVASRRTGIKLTDAHNGLRLLRRDAFSKIRLEQNRMAHANEIISQLAGLGLPWKEHPVNIRYTDYSRGKGQSLWNSINILTELILN